MRKVVVDVLVTFRRCFFTLLLLLVLRWLPHFYFRFIENCRFKGKHRRVSNQFYVLCVIRFFGQFFFSFSHVHLITCVCCRLSIVLKHQFVIQRKVHHFRLWIFLLLYFFCAFLVYRRLFFFCFSFPLLFSANFINIRRGYAIR